MIKHPRVHSSYKYRYLHRVGFLSDKIAELPLGSKKSRLRRQLTSMTKHHLHCRYPRTKARDQYHGPWFIYSDLAKDFTLEKRRMMYDNCVENGEMTRRYQKRFPRP